MKRKKIHWLAPIWKKIATPDFWRSIPSRTWRMACRILIEVLEFSPKAWLYEQAYPRDRYDVPDRDDRYSRL